MRLRPFVVPSIALALLAGCTDDPPATPVVSAPAPSAAVAPEVSLDVPTDDIGSFPPRIEPGDEAASAGRMLISATGVGPYQVGEAQTEIVDDGAITGAVAANGCATGSVFFGKPTVRFVDGKVAEVRVTDATGSTAEGVLIGADLAKVQATYPAGRAVTGAAGVTGWETVDDTNALLVELTGGKVTALTGGVATTVQQSFTSGQPC